MSGRDVMEAEKVQLADVESGTDLLRPLMEAGSAKAPQPIPQAGIVIGELIGMTNEGRTPLVRYLGQPGTAALFARTVVDLHGPHIGHQVALMFEDADPSRPIVMGILQEGDGWPLDKRPDQVDIDVDGERLLITAKEQLVLRCGKASITLTKAGKVMIKGSYVVSRSSGVNRIKGGSVQLN